MKAAFPRKVEAIARAACLGLLLAVLAGCATPTQTASMVATSAIPITNHHSGSVSITTMGGAETSSGGVPRVSNADLAAAIAGSIETTRLFDGVAGSGLPAPFALRAVIVNVEQQLLGASMTAKIEIAWLLTRSGDPKPLWSASHTSEFTAPFNAAFAGATRVRIATEGATRVNIEWALHEMSRLGPL